MVTWQLESLPRDHLLKLLDELVIPLYLDVVYMLMTRYISYPVWKGPWSYQYHGIAWITREFSRLIFADILKKIYAAALHSMQRR